MSKKTVTIPKAELRRLINTNLDVARQLMEVYDILHGLRKALNSNVRNTSKILDKLAEAIPEKPRIIPQHRVRIT